jgi:hypothetical protein
MYRMWKGLEPRFVLSLTGTAVTLIVIFNHILAINTLGWPKYVKAKYNPPAAQVAP